MSDHRIRRYRINLRIERDNAALYARLAKVATDVRLARAYQRIAEGEQANADFWESRLRETENQGRASLWSNPLRWRQTFSRQST